MQRKVPTSEVGQAIPPPQGSQDPDRKQHKTMGCHYDFPKGFKQAQAPLLFTHPTRKLLFPQYHVPSGKTQNVLIQRNKGNAPFATREPARLTLAGKDSGNQFFCLYPQGKSSQGSQGELSVTHPTPCHCLSSTPWPFMLGCGGHIHCPLLTTPCPRTSQEGLSLNPSFLPKNRNDI